MKEIIVLTDNRIGTASQAIGLAKEISSRCAIDYKIIKLSYSLLSSLPNYFFKSSLLRLTSANRREIQNLDSSENLIISAGRRAAPIALFLKEHSRGKSKIIQIMNPNLDFEKFDWVILPKHDECADKKFSNVIQTVGALTRIDQNLVDEEYQKFSEEFSALNPSKKSKVVLLVGGSSNKTKFEKESAKNLANSISRIVQRMNGILLVITSRRTREDLAESLKSDLKCDFKFFDWNEVRNKNPYPAVLKYGDFFVVTGDSVSMISECCITGKPVYIFDEKNLSSKKHRRFHQALLSNGNAKLLMSQSIKLEDFSPKILEETKRIAEIISGQLLVGSSAY